LPEDVFEQLPFLYRWPCPAFLQIFPLRLTEYA